MERRLGKHSEEEEEEEEEEEATFSFPNIAPFTLRDVRTCTTTHRGPLPRKIGKDDNGSSTNVMDFAKT